MNPDVTNLDNSGIEQLRRMAETTVLGPMMRLMKQSIVDVGPGSATVESIPSAEFENSMRRMHGGFVATLIDSALGCAVMTVLPAGTGYGTVDMSVKFVRKIDVATGPLLAKANVVHAGRTMVTAETKVMDKEGKIYAHGLGTFLVYPTKG